MNNPTSPARPGVRFAAANLQIVEAEPPVVSIAPPKKKVPSVALTVSLPASVVRRARMLASAKGVSLSRLLTNVLAVAVKEQLPGLLKDLTNEDGAP